MNSLLRKEFRAQRPFLFLIVVFALADSVYNALRDFPDHFALAQLLAQGLEEPSDPIPYFIICFALALGLLVREKDEGTLEFLDGLPCSRTRVFAAKIITGWLLIVLMMVIEYAALIGLHAISRDSIDPGWHAPLLARSFAIDCFALMVFLGLGLALSFLRRFAWLALALLFAGYMAAGMLDLPWVDLLNLFAPMRDYAFDGDTLLIPWPRIGALGALAALCYAIAWIGFLLQGDRQSRLVTWLERWRLRGLAVATGTALIVVVWIGLMAFHYSDAVGELEAEEGTIAFAEWKPSRAHSGGYTFMYPGEWSGRAAPLVAGAEEVHVKVREFFGAEAPGILAVDLNSNLRHGLGGSANWKRVNMNLRVSEDPAELGAILGHETAHVYVSMLSDGRVNDHFPSTRWFNEGLATYLEYRFFRRPEALARTRRLAAAAFHRKQADFEKLVRHNTWTAEFDSNLVYPLGEVFTTALVSEHGDTAPAILCRAMGARDLPEGLAGLELWRELFQRSGWDLGRAVNGYYALLKSMAEGEHAEFVRSLPRVSARVKSSHQWLVGIELRAHGTLPEGARLMVRARRAVDDGDAEFLEPAWSEGDLFWFERADLPTGEFWLQPGMATKETELPVFEPWQRATAR